MFQLIVKPYIYIPRVYQIITWVLFWYHDEYCCMTYSNCFNGHPLPCFPSKILFLLVSHEVEVVVKRPWNSFKEFLIGAGYALWITLFYFNNIIYFIINFNIPIINMVSWARIFQILPYKGARQGGRPTSTRQEPPKPAICQFDNHIPNVDTNRSSRTQIFYGRKIVIAKVNLMDVVSSPHIH